MNGSTNTRNIFFLIVQKSWHSFLHRKTRKTSRKYFFFLRNNMFLLYSNREKKNASLSHTLVFYRERQFSKREKLFFSFYLMVAMGSFRILINCFPYFSYLLGQVRLAYLGTQTQLQHCEKIFFIIFLKILISYDLINFFNSR